MLIATCIVLYLAGGFYALTLIIWACEAQNIQPTRNILLFNFLVWPILAIHNFFLIITDKED
jgi:hypothetical protein